MRSPVSVPFGEGGNPSPLGEEKVLEIPEGDEKRNILRLKSEGFGFLCT
ncbi:hypothetical protein MYX82_06215 [Acidobacteria bacterium AH-259-D05]|nr:hypothetical protein [Acidobacteria bacterium AH-259-D05]